jgi:hypothetical protein
MSEFKDVHEADLALIEEAVEEYIDNRNAELHKQGDEDQVKRWKEWRPEWESLLNRIQDSMEQE